MLVCQPFLNTFVYSFIWAIILFELRVLLHRWSLYFHPMYPTGIRTSGCSVLLSL